MILRMGVIATSEVVSELNSRNYYLQTTTTTPATSPPVSKPVISRSTYIDYAVQMALQYYNLSATASSKTYLSSTTWNGIVSTAVDISKQLDSQYTVSGLNGLRMSGCCPSVGRLGNMGVPGDIYDPTNYDPSLPEYQSWTSKYGPLLLKIAGSISTIAGEYFETAQLKKMYEELAAQMKSPTTNDQQNTINYLISKGYTREQAEALANRVMQSTQEASANISALPSWVLPVGIAVGAMALLRR